MASNNEKLYGILAIILATLASLTSLVMQTAYPIGYYQTSNGIIEYFSSLNSGLAIKSYLNGNAKPALITVFVNLPNGSVPIEEDFAQSLYIPFSKLRPYMRYWAKWANKINTSLLIIATYFDGSEAYSSAEEITYSPSWIINNVNMQIVAKINVIGKSIPINWSFIKQQIEEFRESLEQKPLPTNETSYPYIVSISMKNIKLKPYSDSSGSYYPCFTEYVIRKVQIPIVWIKISNNVVRKNSFDFMLLSAIGSGYINFYGIVNSSNYVGPYVGVSFSELSSWGGEFPGGYQHSLKKLDNPGYYVYDNATIEILKYTIWYVNKNGQSKPINNVTVFQVLWANSTEFSGAIENSAGVTYVYVNGKLNSTLIGNGTLNLLINYLQLAHKFSPKPNGYLNWSHRTIVFHQYSSTKTVVYGLWNYINVYYIVTSNYLSAKEILSPAFPISVEILLSLSFQKTPLWLGLLLNVKLSNTTSYIFQGYESLWLHIWLGLNVKYNNSGHIYISYLSYPLPFQSEPNIDSSVAINVTALTLQSLGFIYNYSSYYGDYNE